MDFDVTLAIQTLRDNSAQLQTLANEIMELRVRHAGLLLQLSEKKNAALKKYFAKEVEVSKTELPFWLKLETYPTCEEEEQVREELKRKREKLEALEEVINATKFAAKLANISINF